MDISTILGILLSFGVMVFGIIVDLSNGFSVVPDKLANFFDASSIIIVVLGTFTCIIAAFPFSQIANMLKHIMICTKGNAFNPAPAIDQMEELAQLARKSGLLALEEKAEGISDSFFKQAIMMVVDGTDPEKTRQMLEAQVEEMSTRHEAGINIWSQGAAFAPGFGMIGTLVGLVNMLRGLDFSDSNAAASLGQNMAVALITTFYGSLLSNAIFLPVARKLTIRNGEEILYRLIIIEGVLSIQSGDNPKFLREKLVSLLSQKQKNKLLSSGGKLSDGE